MDIELKNPEILEQKIAFNKISGDSFIYYDERDEEILVRHPRTNELIWSPKHLWSFELPKSVTIQPKQISLAEETKFPAVILDSDTGWVFKITESEKKALDSGTLKLIWSPVKELIRDVNGKIIARNYVYEWGLANRNQRELVLDNIDYSKYPEKLTDIATKSEWASIRWLKFAPKWRDCHVIKRTPMKKVVAGRRIQKFKLKKPFRIVGRYLRKGGCM